MADEIYREVSKTSRILTTNMSVYMPQYMEGCYKSEHCTGYVKDIPISQLDDYYSDCLYVMYKRHKFKLYGYDRENKIVKITESADSLRQDSRIDLDEFEQVTMDGRYYECEKDLSASQIDSYHGYYVERHHRVIRKDTEKFYIKETDLWNILAQEEILKKLVWEK